MVTSGVWCVCYYTYCPTVLLLHLPSDGTGANSIARNLVKHELTKHIGVGAFFVRAAGVQDQVIVFQYVPFELQLADFFMKARTRSQHGFYLFKLGVVDPPEFEGVECYSYIMFHV